MGFLTGAGDPIRTDDLLITSELLYQLSHTSKIGGWAVYCTARRTQPRIVLCHIFGDLSTKNSGVNNT